MSTNQSIEVSNSNQPISIPFGREDIVRMIFEKINDPSSQGSQCFALVGPPLIGKSKVLDCITSPHIQKKFNLNLDLIYPIRFDCINIPMSRSGVYKLLGELIIDIFINKWKIMETNENKLFETVSQINDTEKTKVWFENLLVNASIHGRSVVFVLDHFEKLLLLLEETDVQFLRDLFSNSRHALVVAVPKPLIDLTPKTFPSKFYEIFRHEIMRLYSTSQAEKYLQVKHETTEYSFNKDEVDLTLQKAGCHPHFLQVYRSLIMTEKKRSTFNCRDLDTVSLIDQNALDILKNDFLRVWQAMDADQQNILSSFARGNLPEETNIAELQNLESEFGIVYKSEGHYHIMGELFRSFIVSQTEIINQLAKNDFFSAGIIALQKLKDSKYWGTDPLVYYKQAFLEYTKDYSDHNASREMSRQAFEQFLDMLVKRLEIKMKQLCPGDEILEKIDFLKKCLGLESKHIEFLKIFWELLNEECLDEMENEKYQESVFRFSVLSATIQFLVNKPFKHSVFINSQSVDDEYEILNKIGETNHSLLYKAQHKLIRTRFVTIKTVVLNTNDPDSIDQYHKRLIREAEIVASLKHPNIGEVYHIVLNPLKVIMEWVDGQSLENLLSNTPDYFTNSTRVIQIGTKLAEILEYAHSKGVIHRDIKPSNVIINPSGEPVLIDFDIARAVNLSTISLTNKGEYGYLGTVEYSSPEQFLNPKGVKESTDIFSLGVLLYKLLTQKLPFEDGNYPALYSGGYLPQPLKRNISDGLYEVVSSCLIEAPDQRVTASELRIKLMEYLIKYKL